MNQNTPHNYFSLMSLLASILAVLIAQNSYAESDNYKLNLVEIPGFIDSESSGVGAILNAEVLNRINKNHGINFNISLYPAKRAVTQFNKGKADVVFSMILGDSSKDLTMTQSNMTIDSAPIAGSGYAIFTLKNNPKISSMKELEGKSIGALNGVTLPKSLINDFAESIDYVQSMEQNFKKLRLGRIDAIVTIKAAGTTELERFGITDIHYGDEFQYVFACYSAHLNEKGSKLIEYINHAIGEIIKDGTYRKLVGGYSGSILDQ